MEALCCGIKVARMRAELDASACCQAAQSSVRNIVRLLGARSVLVHSCERARGPGSTGAPSGQPCHGHLLSLSDPQLGGADHPRHRRFHTHCVITGKAGVSSGRCPLTMLSGHRTSNIHQLRWHRRALRRRGFCVVVAHCEMR